MNTFKSLLVFMLGMALTALPLSNQGFCGTTDNAPNVEVFGPCGATITNVVVGTCTNGAYSVMATINFTGGTTQADVQLLDNGSAIAATQTATTSGQTLTFNVTGGTTRTITISALPTATNCDNTTSATTTTYAEMCGGMGGDCKVCDDVALTDSDTNGGVAGDPFCADAFASGGTITTSGRAVNQNIMLTASNSITMNSGFEIPSGSTLLAQIEAVPACSLAPFAVNNEGISVQTELMPAELTITPNPVSKNAQVAYELAEEGRVVIQVYNMKGQKVATLANGVQAAGQHTIDFDAVNLNKGFYYLTLQTNTSQTTKQMVIMR